MKTIILTALGLLMWSTIYSRDSIDLPQQRIVLGGMYELAHKNYLKTRYGNGYDLSLNYERQVLRRVFFSTGLNLNLKEKEGRYITDERVDYQDTISLLHTFDEKERLLKLSIPFEFRFSYLKNPKLYIMLGIGIGYKVKEKIERIYVKTAARNMDYEVITEQVRDNVILPEAYPSRKFLLNLDIGCGIEIRKTAIELIVRQDSALNIGIRIRRQLAAIGMNEK